MGDRGSAAMGGDVREHRAHAAALLAREARWPHIGDVAFVPMFHEDLEQAIRLALKADRKACAQEGERYEWDICTDRFLEGLAWREEMTLKPARTRRLASRTKVAETV